MERIRQPIVTVVGHVDHGKTTILDSIRETIIARKEAGGITQKISCTCYPIDLIQKKCSGLLEQFNIQLEIPGFLFIDTPGHAAFTNLRKRGGTLADLAILVIDINEGFMPQTIECMEILKSSKVPFIVALNKVDAVHGWKRNSEKLEEDINSQQIYVKNEFEKKFSMIVEALSSHGFNADIFYRISDFTKQVALVPCSGKTAEGIKELIIMLCGLTQKFLKGKLQISEEARGTVLEVKREKSIIYVEAVLYDGTLKQGDTVAIASFDEPITSKIRILSEALPLCKGFKTMKGVTAAAGIRMQLANSAEILPGMPFSVVKQNNKEQVIKALKQEIEKTIRTEKEGVIAKADSLGSLEALLVLLNKEGIKVSKALIGSVNKVDLMNAAANLQANPLNAVVLGFNVSVDEDARDARIKVLANDVIYRLIEDFQKWLVEKQKEIQRETLEKLVLPCKLGVLRFVFRQSKPAIFGVHVEAGILKAGTEMINAHDEKVSEIKAIQSENKSVEEVGRGMDVAVSMPNITFGRQVHEGDILYSEMSEENFRNLKKNKQYLSADEIAVLQEIATVKRKKKATWGV
ncbi:translation initiation factor IF-2 [Candidatus Pacearchaeota archaeon]|nr:translation initiation factor IF-2 [Candidatus Pacearchaeota archaeon]